MVDIANAKAYFSSHKTYLENQKIILANSGLFTPPQLSPGNPQSAQAAREYAHQLWSYNDRLPAGISIEHVQSFAEQLSSAAQAAMINPEISDSEVDQWVETRILTTCLLGIQSHNIGDEEASNELFAQAQLAAEEYNSQGALEFRESRLRLLGIALALRAEATVARLRTQTRAEMKLVFNDAERHIISEVDNVLAQAQSLFRESDSYTHLAWVSALWKQIFDQRAASEEQWPVLLASYAPRMSNRLEVDVASALSQAVASGEKFTEVSGRYFHTDLALTGPKAGPTAGYLDWKQAETQLGRPLRHPHQALDRTPSQFELAKRVAETAQALHKGDFTTAESLFGSVPYDVTRLGPGIVVASIADRIARPTYPTTRAHPLQETARALVAAMRPEIPVTGALNNPVRK